MEQTIYAILLVGLVLGLVVFEIGLRLRIFKFLFKLFRKKWRL